MFMKIELWSLDRIRPYPNNPRINDDAVDAVAASIREFGVRQAIVVDTEGVIRASSRTDRLRQCAYAQETSQPVRVPTLVKSFTRDANKV
jgi:hypothetical protein